MIHTLSLWTHKWAWIYLYHIKYILFLQVQHLGLKFIQQLVTKTLEMNKNNQLKVTTKYNWRTEIRVSDVTRDVESVFTPVALGLVTDSTDWVITRRTHHGLLHFVGPIWTGLMAVSVKPAAQEVWHPCESLKLDDGNEGAIRRYSQIISVFTFQAGSFLSLISRIIWKLREIVITDL